MSSTVTNAFPFVNTSPAGNNTNNQPNDSEFIFIAIVIAIVIAWVLIALFTRLIENFSFGTLGFNGDSTWHSFLIAFGAIIILLAIIWVEDQYQIIPRGNSSTNNLVEQSLAGGSPFVSTNTLT
jgi:hypothetical protein